MNAAAAGNSQNSLTLRCDCATAAAPSLGPYDCVLLPGLYGWATAWLLLLLYWGRITALCCPDLSDYGRLRDCCCCFIGAVWLRSVFGTIGDCVTAAVASLGPSDCVMFSGLWPTAWLLLLPHRGRMTAFSVRDLGGTAWLLLLLHWGRMIALCCLDYGRLRDCCCCFTGAVWLRYVFGTIARGGGTHYMKVTTYAPPFRPPFFGSLENLYSFDPYILAKMRKMSYFDPYLSSKLGKMYSFDPPFSTLVAFRVCGRCWASLSKTWPSTPPRGL